MSQLFAVTRSHGPGWDPLRPMEEQENWASHAAFMNALHSEGFVLLGGPLEGMQKVLLIVRAHDAQEIEHRLSGDPWSDRLLSVTQIVPWTLRLGSI